MAYWGWTQQAGVVRVISAIGLPIVAAALWYIFAVPDEPHRRGEAPVAVPGTVRLVLELALFAFAAWGLYNAGAKQLSWIMGVVVLVHYVISYDRVGWLIRQ